VVVIDVVDAVTMVVIGTIVIGTFVKLVVVEAVVSVVIGV